MATVVLEQKTTDESELVSKILQSENRNLVVQTTLQTNEQVIARVTDGIYRQPASSLRELISNAYDADATRVVIKTDAPRFDKITIEDDGSGMSPEVLAYLLFNIGGSAKRNDRGEEIGITSRESSLRSPKGRRLIGKIGIGLFSVSQLTHSFQIITKTKGDNHRTIATVALRQFSDSEVAPAHGERRFESGKVSIWREKATDKDRHGTTIVLNAIRPQARDTLRSRDIWAAIERNEDTASEEEKQAIEPPLFHIGRVDSSGMLLKRTGSKYLSLPWTASDKPAKAFEKLVACVWEQLEEANPNPKLERIFDYYLRMVWQLGLAVPLPYVDGHLFDMPVSGWTKTFEISNKRKGSAKLVEGTSTIRAALGLLDPKESIGRFEVVVDDLKLARPIKFRNLPTSSHALKRPLVFIGKCDEKFPKIPAELSGGRLQFEAYLFWSPKIAPSEHQGSLIRIHGASGTLFDPTFMRYQVAELTRLRQITCEIFVSEGLDSALNIDRESFNNAHPHAVYITRWLHEALRQLATAQKKEAGSVRVATREVAKDARIGAIQQIASQVWTDHANDAASSPPSVEIIDGDRPTKRHSDSYVYRRPSVTGRKDQPKTAKERARVAIIEEKLKAIAQVLASFDLIDRLTRGEQESLFCWLFTEYWKSATNERAGIGKPDEADTSPAAEDLASDIVGVQGYAFSLPPKKSFLPWHRPRKQFVRNDQWCYYIAELINENEPDTGTLTHFGLPGVDLLDVRYFGSVVCEPRDLKLRFVGFEKAANPKDEAQADFNVSFDEVSKTPSFDPRSEIVPDDIRELVHENSLAWQKTFECAPYDVINLDLCDGIGAKSSKADETYYNAIAKLLAVQMRKKSPWLLLLTTRVGKEHIHADTLDRLANLYRLNLTRCDEFQKASAERFKIADAESLQKARKLGDGLQSIFLVGICKWLLSFAVRQTPPSKMEVKSVYGYRVDKRAQVEDMVSIAIRFNPTHGPLGDPIKLASIQPEKVDECDLAAKALKKVGKLFDVDEYLRSEKTIRDEMIEAMCKLLEAARYDIDEYRRWVETY